MLIIKMFKQTAYRWSLPNLPGTKKKRKQEKYLRLMLSLSKLGELSNLTLFTPEYNAIC